MKKLIPNSKYHPNKGKPIEKHPWRDKMRFATEQKKISNKLKREIFVCPACGDLSCIAGECSSE